jgi:hypothetical protein
MPATNDTVRFGLFLPGVELMVGSDLVGFVVQHCLVIGRPIRPYRKHRPGRVALFKTPEVKRITERESHILIYGNALLPEQMDIQQDRQKANGNMAVERTMRQWRASGDWIISLQAMATDRPTSWQAPGQQIEETTPIRA